MSNLPSAGRGTSYWAMLMLAGLLLDCISGCGVNERVFNGIPSGAGTDGGQHESHALEGMTLVFEGGFEETLVLIPSVRARWIGTRKETLVIDYWKPPEDDEPGAFATMYFSNMPIEPTLPLMVEAPGEDTASDAPVAYMHFGKWRDAGICGFDGFVTTGGAVEIIEFELDTDHFRVFAALSLEVRNGGWNERLATVTGSVFFDGPIRETSKER